MKSNKECKELSTKRNSKKKRKNGNVRLSHHHRRNRRFMNKKFSLTIVPKQKRILKQKQSNDDSGIMAWNDDDVDLSVNLIF